MNNCYILLTYFPDCTDESNVLKQRLASLNKDVVEKRSRVDALSTRMANLSRHQKFQVATHQQIEVSLNTLMEVLVKYNSKSQV